MYVIDESSAVTYPNGSVCYLSLGCFAGLAAIRYCPVTVRTDSGNFLHDVTRRSVRITGAPDSFFSVPARCSIGGRTVSGFVMWDSGVNFDGPDRPEGYVFIPTSHHEFVRATLGV